MQAYSIKSFALAAGIGARKRPHDMPLTGRILRDRKGVYTVIISFTETKRHYSDEIVYAPNAQRVREHIAKMYPTIKWRKS